MRFFGAVTAAILAVSAVAFPAAAEETGNPRLAPLSFLAGHCWSGTFPNGAATDRHCYSWMLGGKFLRDVHEVAGEADPYGGETVFFWDSESEAIRYVYFNTVGAISRGTAQPADGAILFPEERYVSAQGEEVYRTTLIRDGADAYKVETLKKAEDGSWAPAWSMRLVREGTGD